jgi:hypothetical protein
VAEAAEKMEMSIKTVYDWIYKSKFIVVDTPSGKCIKITPKEIDEVRERNIKRLNRITSKNITQNNQNIIENSKTFFETSQNLTNNSENFIDNSKLHSQNFTENNIDNNAIMFTMMEQIKELTQKVESYAKSEGKIELLTSNIIQEKEDSQFYKNEYFKLKYEIEMLQKRNKELEDFIKKIPFASLFKK